LVLLLVLFAGVGVAAPAQSDIDALLSDAMDQAGEGNLDEALSTLQLAVETEPSSSVAYTRLGGVQVLKQDYRSGIQSFQQAIMLDQTNADAFVGMALAYLHLGQYALAREALKEAAQLDPSKQPEIDKVLAWLDQRPNSAGH
jgi:Flp pilus assembly protein TadD